VTRPSYETWLKDTKCLGRNESVVFIQVPNAYVAEALETRMYSLITSSLRDVTGQSVEAEFVVLAEVVSQ
jgi:chromosomal replication initiator protein